MGVALLCPLVAPTEHQTCIFELSLFMSKLQYIIGSKIWVLFLEEDEVYLVTALVPWGSIQAARPLPVDYTWTWP